MTLNGSPATYPVAGLPPSANHLGKEGMMITRDEALTEREFHANDLFNSDGSCARYRRNGKTQTWKRDPQRFRLPVKHGMYRYDQITEHEADQYHLASKCPRDRMGRLLCDLTATWPSQAAITQALHDVEQAGVKDEEAQKLWLHLQLAV